MFFEAELKGKKYQINVTEKRSNWVVSLQKEDGDWKRYDIPKEDYQEMDGAISFLFKKHCFMIDVVGDGLDYTAYTRGSYRSIKIKNDEMLLHESLKKGGGMGADGELVAGMPGKIVKVMVKNKQKVEEGQPLLVMEAMKMENEMRAAQSGTIDKVHVKGGDSVDAGVTLISFKQK